MSQSLVVYYSRKGENYFPDGIRSIEKGNTAYAAEYAARAVNADLFEIETVMPYAQNYRACCMEAVAEAKANARPEITAYLEDISDYDAIFVCFPCWCGTAPMCVFTFLEHYDLTGKKMANSEADLKKYCPGAIVLPGLSVKGHQAADSEALISHWAKNSI